MRKSVYLMLLTLLVLSVVLTACSKMESSPANTVQAYWQAVVERDRDSISQLTCADYEAAALTNFDSFQSVDIKLEGISCMSSENPDGSTEVTCNGLLKASYGAEETDFDLSIHHYQLINEKGSWLICGEE